MVSILISLELALEVGCSIWVRFIGLCLMIVKLVCFFSLSFLDQGLLEPLPAAVNWKWTSSPQSLAFGLLTTSSRFYVPDVIYRHIYMSFDSFDVKLNTQAYA